MDFLDGIAGALRTLDPIGSAVDFGERAIGLPPAVRDATKVGLGTALGNPIMILDGAVSAFKDSRDAAAATQYCPGYGYSACGYAPSSSSNLWGPCAPNAWGSPGWGSPAMGPFAPFPGISWGPPPALGPCPIPPAMSQCAGPGPGGYGHFPACGSDLARYRDALGVMDANYSKFSSLPGFLAPLGFVTRDRLAAIAREGSASPELRQSARFLVDHTEFFDRLDVGAGIGGLDGKVGLADVRAERSRVNAQLAGQSALGAYGWPPSGAGLPGAFSPGTRGGSPAGFAPSGLALPPAGWTAPMGGGVRSIVCNPGMSLEEKVQAVMGNASYGLDQQIESTMGQIANLSSQQAGNPPAGSQTGTDIQQLQLRLQMLIERRSQMFQMQSNMMEQFNQMSMTAIRNIDR